ncbi:MAG: phosphoribosyl-AMP cyclohydrolase [Clostridiaceae bacterium]|jgi:phosphoribosyl-AMP cyclohydrolase|nr:phosphoribosyl-AMP cyclohydrolase [Clostridiaceae bacterium]
MESFELKYDEKGLIPAIVQDSETKEVLMMAYMNRESLLMTVKTRKATYWSRSRKKLWVKGETSGNFQYVEKIYYDCDADTLLLLVRQKGAACHTGSKSCFYRELDMEGYNSEQ